MLCVWLRCDTPICHTLATPLQQNPSVSWVTVSLMLPLPAYLIVGVAVWFSVASEVRTRDCKCVWGVTSPNEITETPGKASSFYPSFLAAWDGDEFLETQQPV